MSYKCRNGVKLAFYSMDLIEVCLSKVLVGREAWMPSATRIREKLMEHRVCRASNVDHLTSDSVVQFGMFEILYVLFIMGSRSIIYLFGYFCIFCTF